MSTRALGLICVLLVSFASAACAAERLGTDGDGSAGEMEERAEVPKSGPKSGLESGPDAEPGFESDVLPDGEEAAVEQDKQESMGFDHTHSLWDSVLKQHVQGALFDYAALAKDTGAIDAYIAELRSVGPEDLKSWSKEQRFAFWVNAYNAFTIKKVVKNLPLKSIRDLDKAFGLTTVFEQSWIKLESLHPSGKAAKLSLNDIEHEILRKRFKDARVHAAVNCASWSCPPLRGEAFVAERLDEQLDGQMRAFIADRERNLFQRDKGQVQLSEIFKWFAEDFEREAGSVRAYLVRYASQEDAAFLETATFKYVDYSWKLNAPKPSK